MMLFYILMLSMNVCIVYNPVAMTMLCTCPRFIRGVGYASAYIQR